MISIEMIGMMSILMCMQALSFGACALAIALGPGGRSHRCGEGNPHERKGKWKN